MNIRFRYKHLYQTLFWLWSNDVIKNLAVKFKLKIIFIEKNCILYYNHIYECNKFLYSYIIYICDCSLRKLLRFTSIKFDSL